MKQSIQRITAVGATCLMAFGLAACGSGSKTGAMTCQEYGELTVMEKSSVHTKLLREHDLVTSSPSNITGVNDAMSRFCGSSIGKATKNLDNPIEEATDWTSSTW